MLYSLILAFMYFAICFVVLPQGAVRTPSAGESDETRALEPADVRDLPSQFSGGYEWPCVSPSGGIVAAPRASTLTDTPEDSDGGAKRVDVWHTDPLEHVGSVVVKNAVTSNTWLGHTRIAISHDDQLIAIATKQTVELFAITDDGIRHRSSIQPLAADELPRDWAALPLFTEDGLQDPDLQKILSESVITNLRFVHGTTVIVGYVNPMGFPAHSFAYDYETGSAVIGSRVRYDIALPMYHFQDDVHGRMFAGHEQLIGIAGEPGSGHGHELQGNCKVEWERQVSDRDTQEIGAILRTTNIYEHEDVDFECPIVLEVYWWHHSIGATKPVRKLELDVAHGEQFDFYLIGSVGQHKMAYVRRLGDVGAGPMYSLHIVNATDSSIIATIHMREEPVGCQGMNDSEIVVLARNARLQLVRRVFTYQPSARQDGAMIEP